MNSRRIVTGFANLRPEEMRGLDVLAKPFKRGDLAARIAERMDARAAKIYALTLFIRENERTKYCLLCNIQRTLDALDPRLHRRINR